MPRTARIVACLVALLVVPSAQAAADDPWVCVSGRTGVPGAGPPYEQWIGIPADTNIRSAEMVCDLVPDATSVSQNFEGSPDEYTFDCITGACSSLSASPIPEPGTCFTDCFCLDPGQGVVVRRTALEEDIQIRGQDTATVSYAVPGGMQPVLITPTLGVATAQNLGNEILAALPGASVTIRRRFSTDATFQNHVAGTGIGDFAIEAGIALEIVSDTAGTFTLPGVPSAWPTCVTVPSSDSRQYCITNVSSNVTYAWFVDENGSTTLTAGEPTDPTEDAVSPVGSPAEALAISLARGISENTQDATVQGNWLGDGCFEVYRLGGPKPGCLFVGGCNACVSTCTYNPDIRLDTDRDHYSDQLDCDPSDPVIFPGAEDSTCDGINQDCSDPAWPEPSPEESDDDGDGFVECVPWVGAGSISGGDCNDLIASIYPGALQECDGVNTDCDDASWPSVPADETDDDGDGYVECGPWTGTGSPGTMDCDDANPATYPGGIEVNDGQDNQCPGDPGNGVADEVAGGLTPVPGSPGTFAWQAQDGAVSYQMLRATTPEFGGACETWETTGTQDTDPEAPPPGLAYYYLLRALAPFLGSWGQTASGEERIPACDNEFDCSDGSDNDGDGSIDCADPECWDSPSCPVETFSFVDTAADDVSPTALRDFFANLIGTPNYILFEVDRVSAVSAFCADQAGSFHVADYLALAPATGTAPSNGISKWYRRGPIGAPWSTTPITVGYVNVYGAAAFGQPYGWRPEVGLGGMDLGVRPEGPGSCEILDSGCNTGNWTLTIRVGPTRIATCGF